MSERAVPSTRALEQAEKSLSQMAYDRLLERLITRDIPVGSVLFERKLADSLKSRARPFARR